MINKDIMKKLEYCKICDTELETQLYYIDMPIHENVLDYLFKRYVTLLGKERIVEYLRKQDTQVKEK